MTIIIPEANPSDYPMVGVRFNKDWLRLVLSALMAYERNYLYPDATPSELKAIMAKVEAIQAQFTEVKLMTVAGLPLGTFINNGGYMNDPEDGSGYVPCDGSIYQRDDYPDFWEYWNIAIGRGAVWEIDEDTFTVPNLNSPKRFIRGATTEDGETGETGIVDGEDEVTLTVDQIPSHTHGVVSAYTFAPQASGLLGAFQGIYIGSRTEGEGGGQAHNNVPASMRIPFFIAIR